MVFDLARIVVDGVGVSAAILGGWIAFGNASKAVLWKKAELANAQLKELNTSEELVFACRCLDWDHARLVVPAAFAPLLFGAEKVIAHDKDTLKQAMRPNLTLAAVTQDPRLQIYRMAMDTLLTWLSATSSAISRNLYGAADIVEAKYWLEKVYQIEEIAVFAYAFGYREPLEALAAFCDVSPGSIARPHAAPRL